MDYRIYEDLGVTVLLATLTDETSLYRWLKGFKDHEARQYIVHEHRSFIPNPGTYLEHCYKTAIPNMELGRPLLFDTITGGEHRYGFIALKL